MIWSKNGDAAHESKERAVLQSFTGKKCRVARVLPISFKAQEEHSHHRTNILPNNTVKYPAASRSVNPSNIYIISTLQEASKQPKQA